MDGMERQVLSVQETNFKDKDTGETRQMWKVYIADDTGAVGCIYSTKPVAAGEVVSLSLAVNRDGRFTVKIVQ